MQFVSGEYASFVCRGLDGEICVMKNHMPMVLAVDVGVVVLTDADGEKHTAACGSGFLEVRENDLFRLLPMGRRYRTRKGGGKAYPSCGTGEPQGAPPECR